MPGQDNKFLIGLDLVTRLSSQKIMRKLFSGKNDREAMALERGIICLHLEVTYLNNKSGVQSLRPYMQAKRQ